MPQAARHSATVMVDMIAQTHSLQPGKNQNHLKRRLKQITLTATSQIILMMVLNKTMRMAVFLTTQFRSIWMSRNKDKGIK